MGNEFVSGLSASTDGDGSPQGDAVPVFTYTQIFEQQCPFYMAMGMSYDEFWNGEAELCKMYRKANEIKRRQQNEMLWLQGMYVYEALCDVAPIFNANAKKGTKANPYTEEPYPITKQEVKEYKERKERKEAEKRRENFEAMVAKFNSSFRDKKNKKKEGDLDGRSNT